MDNPLMEVSSGEESSGTPRSDASRERSATVTLELFKQQLENNKKLQDELAKLNATIAELRRQLQELRKSHKSGKRKKPRVIESYSSSEEDEPRATPAAREKRRTATPELMEEAPPAPIQETPPAPIQETPPAPTQEAQPAPTQEA